MTRPRVPDRFVCISEPKKEDAMNGMRRMASAALAAGVAMSIAACGSDEDERLSKQETTKRLNETFAATSAQIQQQFHPVFEQLQQGRENAPVPDRVRAQLDQPAGAAADALRDAADQAEELDPPSDVEDEINSFAEAARQQATRLEELAAQERITVRELADAVAPPMDELQRLSEAGIEVQPPPTS